MENEHSNHYQRAKGVVAMDSSSAYLLGGSHEGQMTKIKATEKEISMKRGKQIFKRKWASSS